MLQKLLESTGIGAQTCARLLGISPRVFGEWVAGQRPVPASMLPLLSNVLGVQPATLQLSAKQAKARGLADVTPAIWYKFRSEGLTDADRECVLLIRGLGYFLDQLEEVTEKRAIGWKTLFEEIRREVDVQAPPAEQGRRAARMFRESTGLSQGAGGLGTVLRGYLRRMGLLVIETPVPESQIEGCSFYVGSHPSERPCIFANTHHSTWFRRNVVLMHEVGHAIFDSASAGASLDFVGLETTTDLPEERAQAFAQEALVPREVLRHVSQAKGIKWDALTSYQLAILVAETHVEKKTIIRAAVEAQFIAAELAEKYASLEIVAELKELTERALSTEEYIQKHGKEAAKTLLLGKRTTTIPVRAIRLPVPYILGVINAMKEGIISRGKAAELLMIDEDAFEARFGELALAAEE